MTYFNFNIFLDFYSFLKVLNYFFDAIPNMSVKKSDVVRAVIVRTSKSIRRESGMFIKFDQNAAVIINADGSPRGSLSFNFE